MDRIPLWFPELALQFRLSLKAHATIAYAGSHTPVQLAVGTECLERNIYPDGHVQQLSQAAWGI